MALWRRLFPTAAARRTPSTQTHLPRAGTSMRSDPLPIPTARGGEGPPVSPNIANLERQAPRRRLPRPDPRFVRDRHGGSKRSNKLGGALGGSPKVSLLMYSAALQLPSSLQATPSTDGSTASFFESNMRAFADTHRAREMVNGPFLRAGCRARHDKVACHPKSSRNGPV